MSKEIQGGTTRTISPGVVIDERAYTPPGWMWVLGFALAGCEWAIREAESTSFRRMVARDLRKRKENDIRDAIRGHRERIGLLEEQIRLLEERLRRLPTDE